jgi:hypothetical protein
MAALLDAGELEHVAVDQRIAQLLLDDAGRHLATAATALSSGDLSGAYQLAYDALRKSAASLLARQGLRASQPGRACRGAGISHGTVRLNRASLPFIRSDPPRSQQLRVSEHRRARSLSRRCR